MNECLLRVVATACGGRIQLHNRWLCFLARSEYYFDAEVRISKGLFNGIRGNLRSGTNMDGFPTSQELSCFF